MAPTSFSRSPLWVLRLALASGVGLAFACASLGCRTQYRPLVAPLPPQPLAPAIVEIGPVSLAKRKFGLFHQPSLSPGEIASLTNEALRRAPRAEFFTDQQLNAVLRIYPTARLPVWYSLRIEFSGTASRTNLTEANRDLGPR